jgi:hypothetical protein
MPVKEHVTYHLPDAQVVLTDVVLLFTLLVLLIDALRAAG